MKPKNETSRVNYLEQTCLLNSEGEEQFDDIVLMAKSISEMPIALITLIGPDTQWIKAKIGISVDQAPRDVTFCTHVVYLGDELYVPDAKIHPDFKDNPFVLDDTVGFYAGFPIRTKEGYTLGTLCVIDSKSNTLSEKTKTKLRALCRILVDIIEYRTNISQMTTKNKQRIHDLRNTLSLILTAAENNTLKPELVLKEVSKIREELVNWETTLNQKFGRDSIERINIVEELNNALESYSLFSKGEQLKIHITNEQQKELFFTIHKDSFQKAISALSFKLISECSLDIVKIELQNEAIFLPLPKDFPSHKSELLINTISPLMKKSNIDLSIENNSLKLKELS